jgi:ectoine hydroxylase-related dioxygenase (phytanoyl-CoA dioxygenase family)
MTRSEAIREQFPSRVLDALERDGFAMLQNVFRCAEINTWIAELDAAFTTPRDDAEAIRSRQGSVYAARNVLEWFPAARDLWRIAPLHNLLQTTLGKDYGLVRALYFDKPPERTWALPWHKDLTIAVAEHHARSTSFTHPTRKAGVAHVEAPVELLERMLTLRVHFDDVTDENGPLRVAPGSHRTGKRMPVDGHEETSILAEAGDVLAMRPLLAHASGASHPETTRHRRILHLEFAADPELPDRHAWHTFLPGGLG